MNQTCKIYKLYITVYKVIINAKNPNIIPDKMQLGLILQPVLQWGNSPAGGGSFWAITNWFVGSPETGIALHGPLVQVNSGDILQGIMTLQGQSGNKFSYRSSFNGVKSNSRWRIHGDLDDKRNGVRIDLRKIAYHAERRIDGQFRLRAKNGPCRIADDDLVASRISGRNNGQG